MTSDPKNQSNAPFYRTSYRREYSRIAFILRLLWSIVYYVAFRYTPPWCFGWRMLILRCFGARLAPGSRVYPSVRIWGPWNLRMAQGACLGPEVYCYNMAPVSIGEEATVSFRTFLCSASHDIDSIDRTLTSGPIAIERGAYIFADAFIGMNVTIGEGAVVGARAVVVRDVRPFMVVAGNPAQEIRERRLK